MTHARSRSRFRGLLAVALVLVCVPRGTELQAQDAAATGPAWRFQSRPHLDLWYHGLAVVGFEGFGLLPLYHPGYADDVRAAKARRGLAPTALDRAAPDLLAAFDADSLFEVLHFVPLYFEHTTLDRFLDGLTDVAHGREPAELGARIVGAVLTSERQHRVLGTFVDALREEWTAFLDPERQAGRTRREQGLSNAQAYWDRHLATPVRRFRDARGLLGGIAYASPALGAEGRIFAGAQGNQLDNRVALWLPPVEDPGSAMALGLVRELCYPLVSRVVAETGAGHWDRVVAERMSSFGAVRCGADLLDRVAPDQADRYRTVFLVAVGEEEAGPSRFAEIFPVDAAVHQGIQDALARSLAGE